MIFLIFKPCVQCYESLHFKVAKPVFSFEEYFAVFIEEKTNFHVL